MSPPGPGTRHPQVQVALPYPHGGGITVYHDLKILPARLTIDHDSDPSCDLSCDLSSGFYKRPL